MCVYIYIYVVIYTIIHIYTFVYIESICICVDYMFIILYLYIFLQSTKISTDVDFGTLASCSSRLVMEWNSSRLIYEGKKIENVFA